MSTVGTNIAEPPSGQVSAKVVVGPVNGGLGDEIVKVKSVDPGAVESEIEVPGGRLDVEDNGLIGTVPTELVDTL